MDQTTAFSPPVVCKLIDGSFLRFARADMDLWALLAAEYNAERIEPTLKDIEADKTIPPSQKHLAKRVAMDSIVPTYTVMNLCRSEAKHVTKLLTEAAKRAGHSADEIAAKLKLIPPVDQFLFADIVATMPVVKGDKEGTNENPFQPGLDFTSVSTGEKQLPSSSDSDSIPANSPIEPVSNS